MEVINAKEELERFDKSEAKTILSKKYETKSFFEIIAKDTDELIHSKILKWIFELKNLPCKENAYPIYNLLRVVLERAKEQNKSNEIDEIIKDIIDNDVQITVKGVYLEVPTIGVTVGKESGRCDLIIECDIMVNALNKKLTICIENKIDTDEHSSQTWKYYAYLAGKEAVEEEEDPGIKIEIDDDCKRKADFLLFLFLTPHSNLEMEEITNKGENACSCPHFIHINYQDLMDRVLTNLYNLKELDPRTKTFVSEYMNTLSIPYIENNRKHHIMAMTTEDSELLRKFWNENKSLILASLNAFVNDANQDEEERNSAKKAFELLSRPRYLFTFTFKGSTVKNLKMAEVAEHVATYLLQTRTPQKINLLFRKIKKNFMIHDNQYKTISKKKEKDRWRQLETFPEYYVSTQWSYNVTENIKKPNFPRFMEIVNSMNDFNVALQ